MVRSTSRVRRIAVLLLLSSPAAPVMAQSRSSEPIEEIVVTARHRAENLQAVPVSMSAISGAAIEDGRTSTLQELEHMVPNLVFGDTGSSGETHVGIRGIGDFSRNIGFDTRVGIYMDGVFAGQSLAVDTGLVDVAQIEVLRGPQGTLFGKNSSSGALSITSNIPELGVSSGSARVGGGNLDNAYGEGIVNVPLGDIAAARVAVVSKRQDGYVKNLFDGRDLMSADHTFARVRLRVQPSATLGLNLSYDVRRQNNDILFLEPEAAFENGAGNPAAARRRVVDQDADLIDDNSSSGGALTVDYTLPNGGVLTAITGFRSADRKVGSDEDATRAFALHARYFKDDFEHFTQELRFASSDHLPLRYVLGAFYFDQKARTNRTVALGPAFGGPPQGVDAAVQDSAVDT
jgi:iron complex outermembrane recepter protein